ncbi:MAG: ADP-ribosylglycohydrolase family protein [Treponema sp.]|nr:ADP-ribosylglycohydrolase family protein [Treponema sp.]
MVDKINSGGFVIDTLESSLWCFLNNDNYKNVVLDAVNLGEDTDTTACVAGAMAGLYYNDIPSDWIKCLAKKDMIIDIASRM